MVLSTVETELEVGSDADDDGMDRTPCRVIREYVSKWLTEDSIPPAEITREYLEALNRSEGQKAFEQIEKPTKGEKLDAI